MRRAIGLALRGQGHTRPNPDVGAVIVRNGEILGEGWHKRAGGDHAEVAALKCAARRGESVKGATMYVTLEPCSRPGRVGACTDAIAASGLRRVVYGVADPNPKNRGKAASVLSRRGIVCERFRGDAELEADMRKLVEPFAKLVTTGVPFVTVKIAMSLDGRICDNIGGARWISSERSRKETGRLRNAVDAIMVGAETVRRDDPVLLPHGRPNPDLVRVVVSRSGRLPRDAKVFTDGRNETLVFSDAVEALRELGRRGMKHVLCEGGLKLATSLAEAGFVDEWLAVVAPVVIGSRPIDDAVRGTADSASLRLVSGDAFYKVVM